MRNASRASPPARSRGWQSPISSSLARPRPPRSSAASAAGQRSSSSPLLGKGILELTDIISKPYPGASVVPSLCRATFDRRTLVGEDEGVILGQVNEAIARAQEKHPGLKARCYLAEGEEKCWTGETIRAKRYFPAWVVDEDSELVQGAMKGLKDAGIEAKLSHFAFCTNGSSFCGEAGIPCIGYGPSLESLAHVRDEYIEIDQLTKACKGFECILAQLTK